MRLLIVSDIHANWPALAAIDEAFDLCLCLGDVVDYGTDPVPCVEWVMNRAAATVRGNHDHAVAQRVQPRLGRGFRELAALTRPLMWRDLAPLHLKFLSRLPLTQTLLIDGKRLYMVHATPRDPLDEYITNGAEGWRPAIADLDADIILTGHTHVQSLVDVDGRTVLNPGSVGQPRDGDPRVAYAIIDGGRIELKRVPYDIDQTIAQMRRCGAEPRVIELSEAVLRSGGTLPDEL